MCVYVETKQKRQRMEKKVDENEGCRKEKVDDDEGGRYERINGLPGTL